MAQWRSAAWQTEARSYYQNQHQAELNNDAAPHIIPSSLEKEISLMAEGDLRLHRSFPWLQR